MSKQPLDRGNAQLPSALDELLVAEQQIATRSVETAAECAALIAAARADAAASTIAASAELDRDLGAARRETAQQLAALMREVEADTTRMIAQYRDLPDAQVERLAEFIAARVTGLEPQSADGGHG